MSTKIVVILMFAFGVCANAQPLDATQLRSELESVNEQLVFLQSARSMTAQEWHKGMLERFPIIVERATRRATDNWNRLPPEKRAQTSPQVTLFDLDSVIATSLGPMSEQLQARQKQLTQMLTGAASGAPQNGDSARVLELERRVKALEVANQLILARLDELLKR
jgi:hypothetical protein